MSFPNYMDRSEELTKYAAICRANGFTPPSNGSRGQFEMIADGDADLFDAMWKTWNFEHAFDDLLDEGGFSEDQKIAAIAALAGAVEELFYDPMLDKFLNFSELWDAMLRRMNWDPNRRHLANVAQLQFWGMLRFNPFVRKHPKEIATMLVQTMLRCISGDVMERSEDPRKRALAPAVRCGDVDLFMHMIYLARGFAAASAWCGKLGYDCELQGTTEEKK